MLLKAYLQQSHLLGTLWPAIKKKNYKAYQKAKQQQQQNPQFEDTE